MGRSLVERILSRIEGAERREVNPWYQCDYRIAWITVLRASRNEPVPFITAAYTVLGLHPDKVWPAIIARRKALLGPLYESWELDLPPKKPPRSARVPLGRAGKRAA